MGKTPLTTVDVDSERVAVAIIGGGPGGLMAAYLLQKRATFPIEITLFEASDRLGGKVLTTRFASAPDIHYEAGAAEFYDYTQLGPDPLRDLIAELGLATSPMQAGGTIIGNRIVRDASDLRRELGESACLALHQFEQQARCLISQADYYESDWRKDNNESISRQTFHDLLREVPDAIARDYLRMMSHSDLACEPHQTNASYGLQNHLMDEPDYMQLYSITGGNEQLILALAAGISAHVRLEQPVVRVECGPANTYQVTSSRHGQPETEGFDYVVVALPHGSLHTITWAGDQLDTAMREHHRFYDHPGHYLRVTMLFDRPFWRDHIRGSFFMIDAFGGCCLYDESARVDTGEMGVLGWLIAGEPALRLSNLNDATLVNQVMASLPSVLQPDRVTPIDAKVHRWTGSVNALPAGVPARDPDSRHQPEPNQHPGLFVMGDYLFDSTINGVFDSADTVVEWIREEEAPELDAVTTADVGTVN